MKINGTLTLKYKTKESANLIYNSLEVDNENYVTSTINISAEGRLLTYEEANALQSSYASMINGTANTNSGGNYLYYWLATVSADTNDYGYECGTVWTVDGSEGYLSDYGSYNWGNYTGIRPVVTVPKTAIAH